MLISYAKMLQPIRAGGVSIESHSRHAPSKGVFKSEAKIREENNHLYLNYDRFYENNILSL